MSRSKKNINDALFNQVLSFFSNSNNKIFIAYSGGLDSHVLLHLLVQVHKVQPKIELVALHINHNLSPNAKQWANHCKKVCRDFGVDFIMKNVNARIAIKDHSPEEIARKLRYESFAESLPRDAVLVTAHQANDQAETLLLQLFRGAGVKGLAAIPAKIKFANGHLMRPLLSFAREELCQYAKRYQLHWIEDESNADIKFDRNLIRHKLTPLIKKNWPGIITTLNRTAGHCAVANELLENLASIDLATIVGEENTTISIKALTKLSPARQNNVLRFWLQSLHLTMPSEAKLNEIVRTIVKSRNDAVPVVRWYGVEIRKFQNYLHAMPPLSSHNNKIVLLFNFKKPLKLPSDLGVLQAKATKKFTDEFKGKKITVRFRFGGEKINLPKRQGTRQLKKLMQEWQIPPWMRDRIPLVYCDTEIIAVVGYYSIDGVKFCIA